MSALLVEPQAELRAHIRWLLETGRLPLRAHNQKLFGGSGENQICDCCDRYISPGDVLYEVEAESPGHPRLTMHLQCFQAWEMESHRRRREQEESVGPVRNLK
jgi:hypothetical protein